MPYILRPRPKDGGREPYVGGVAEKLRRIAQFFNLGLAKTGRFDDIPQL